MAFDRRRPSGRTIVSPVVLWALLASRAGLLCGADDAASASKEGRRDLKLAIQAGDAEKLDGALAQLSRAGGGTAMRLVLDYLEKMPASEDSLYWSLIGGAVSFRDRAAMEELGKFLVQRKAQPIARDILYGLAKSSTPHIVLPLRPLLTDGPQETRLLVAKRVSRVRSKDAVDALIELLKAEEKLKAPSPTPLMLIAVDGLTKITHQKFGNNSVNWEGWWQKNRKNPLPAGEEEEGESHTGTAVDFIKLSPDRERREAFVGVEQAPLKSVVVLSADYTRKPKKDLNNDHMERVLGNMGVPHTVVRREDFKGYDLKEAGVLLINCAKFHQMCICPDCKPSGAMDNNRLYTCDCALKPERHEQWSAQLSAGEVSKIKAFVMAGGYLFCEDWIAEEVVEKAFGEYVAAEEKKVLHEADVDVMPARGMGTHPYLKGIFEPKFIASPLHVAAGDAAADPGADPAAGAADPAAGAGAVDAGPGEDPKAGTTVVVKPPRPEGVDDEPGEPVKVKHTWKIDEKSYPLKVMDKSRVVTLLTSGKLQKVTGGDGAVALAFRPGSSGVSPGARSVPRGTPGVVTAVLSHFGKQHSTEDEMAIQNLLLNVLIDANAARETRWAKRAEKKAEGKAKDGKKA